MRAYIEVNIDDCPGDYDTDKYLVTPIDPSGRMVSSGLFFKASIDPLAKSVESFELVSK